MSTVPKEYKVKLRTFAIFGWIMLGAGFIYLAQTLMAQNPETFKQAFPGGLAAVLLGLGFLYFGTKTRRIILSDEGIQYWTSRKEFDAEWNDIALIKTLTETNRKSENLVIVTDSEKILTITSAFFDIKILKEAFMDMSNRAVAFPNISVEDDNNWLK